MKTRITELFNIAHPIVLIVGISFFVHPFSSSNAYTAIAVKSVYKIVVRKLDSG